MNPRNKIKQPGVLLVKVKVAGTMLSGKGDIRTVANAEVRGKTATK